LTPEESGGGRRWEGGVSGGVGFRLVNHAPTFIIWISGETTGALKKIYGLARIYGL
jgi:hypothetical protein